MTDSTGRAFVEDSAVDAKTGILLREARSER
jgi:hypothetical protein